MIKLMLKVLLGLAMIILAETCLFSGLALAETVDNTTSLSQENEELKAMIYELEARINNLENELDQKSNNMPIGSTTGALTILFGAFCGLWAQNTGRNAFGWFVLGVIGTVFTVLAVLWNNRYDLEHSRE